MSRPDPLGSSPENLSDEHVKAACAGAAAILNDLLVALTPRVRLMVVARLGHPLPDANTVDEVVQAILVAVAAGIPQLRVQSVAGMLGFVSTIASRKVAAALVRRGALAGSPNAPESLDARVGPDSSIGPLGSFVASGDTTPFAAAVRADQQLALLREIAVLKPDFREIVTLLVIDGISTAEAGQRLGISREAAAMRYHRAVEALRERLAK
ncbi:MAG: RNA polymerase sigma factor [Phycisphaerales bacterium]